MENVNSVCYIDSINSITPIEGADNIVLATINGWNSIIQKDSMKVGDLVVVFTTDAVIPEDLADKMNVKNYLRKGNRVRTVKLKGVYSEALIYKADSIVDRVHIFAGDDMEDILKVYKYEPPVREIQLSNGKKYKYKANSNFHVYYKFPNIKNVPNMFKEDDKVVITRKIHGTNARYGIVKKNKLSLLDKIKKFFGNKWIEWEFVYGSHNVQKGSDTQGYYTEDVWKKVADKYNIKDKLWEVFKFWNADYKPQNNFIIYGEIYGPGIQGEKYTYNETELKLAIFDIEEDNEYLNSFDFDLLLYYLDLPKVPELYAGKWSKEIQDKFVLNNYIEGTKIPHEGVVVKCITGDRKKIAKVINPEYLTYSEKFHVPDSH